MYIMCQRKLCGIRVRETLGYKCQRRLCGICVIEYSLSGICVREYSPEYLSEKTVMYMCQRRLPGLRYMCQRRLSGVGVRECPQVKVSDKTMQETVLVSYSNDLASVFLEVKYEKRAWSIDHCMLCVFRTAIQIEQLSRKQINYGNQDANCWLVNVAEK